MTDRNGNSITGKILTHVLTFLLGMIAVGIFNHIAVADRLKTNELAIEYQDRRLVIIENNTTEMMKIIKELISEFKSNRGGS